jgi:Tfp pilus assembly protein PilN
VIEVNLLPGAKKRPARRSAKPSFSLPKLGGDASSFDRATIGIVAAWILGPGLILWMFLGTGSRREELNLSIEQAVQDSARYAAVIAAQENLRARRDTIARKLEIIQEIDAGRYIWAHILDEISRALPEYTWLTRITPIESDGSLPNFQIVGRTGNTFALTRFMTDLESSPFIREVRLTTTEQVREQGDRVVHEFILLASYEEPPADAIETVPLFVGED